MLSVFYSSTEHLFGSSVVFADEARFGRGGFISIHNQHQWAEENLRGVIHSRDHQQLSINVWAGIVGDCLVGPHVLPHLLIRNHYRDFLLHDLLKLLENVLLVVRARMLYTHDGVSAHFSRVVRNVLNKNYHDRWTGGGGPTAWPPRSPDWNLLYFYLWGHLKTRVHIAPVDNEEALHHHIVDACLTLRNYLGIFERMQRSMHYETCRGVHCISWSTF
jgi:hypothetical protein